ncbi:di-heme oxidoredictase family protein [Kiloniella majae]|uniref:di-heme oxidoreductase family protein n=1 Tax=Kiloniella majae TaxID=1938558 RepID=UPI000A27855E|nr:di-heme oxidoredictase family protein [Kiloniella majae]
MPTSSGKHLPFFCALLIGMSFTSSVNATSSVRSDLSSKDLERVQAITRPTSDFSKAETYENKSAGAPTSKKTVSSKSFSHSSANLSFEGERDFKLGNSLFKKIWVSSPSSTKASDGLGPLFNARSCQRCHLQDGRGHPPESNDDLATSMFLRLSVPARTEAEKQALRSGERLRIPEPTYGGQLQDQAVTGLPAEGKMRISYEEEVILLNGGESVSLRKPSYSVDELSYGDMDPDVMLSPRVAPPMIGLGLLEEIHEQDLLGLADPEDKNNDGISGKASLVLNPETEQKEIGRFGWKASNRTVHTQSANAFAGDIGLSTPDIPAHWGDCTANQPRCLSQPHGSQKNLGEGEAPKKVLDLVVFYSKNLAVPARRNVNDPNVLKGKELFYKSRCTSCHQPKFVTRRDAKQKELAFQLIWPYSDLLLHDMGEGLSDGRPVGNATGREWRTPPLWGIGLTEKVSGHTYFLHDGRARNLLEAIIWHGGEAQAARDKVVTMSPKERNDLISFLESL